MKRKLLFLLTIPFLLTGCTNNPIGDETPMTVEEFNSEIQGVYKSNTLNRCDEKGFDSVTFGTSITKVIYSCTLVYDETTFSYSMSVGMTYAPAYKGFELYTFILAEAEMFQKQDEIKAYRGSLGGYRLTCKYEAVSEGNSKLSVDYNCYFNTYGFVTDYTCLKRTSGDGDDYAIVTDISYFYYSVFQD